MQTPDIFLIRNVGANPLCMEDYGFATLVYYEELNKKEKSKIQNDYDSQNDYKVLNYDKMFRLKKKNVKNEICLMHAV